MVRRYKEASWGTPGLLRSLAAGRAPCPQLQSLRSEDSRRLSPAAQEGRGPVTGREEGRTRSRTNPRRAPYQEALGGEERSGDKPGEAVVRAAVLVGS